MAKFIVLHEFGFESINHLGALQHMKELTNTKNDKLSAMAIKNKNELFKTLGAGLFDQIIGTPESEWLDFKQKPYDTEGAQKDKLSKKGRYELCKDVAAFANQNGGVILIGYKEITSRTTGRSVAEKLTPVKVSSVDLPTYRSAIIARIYPLITFEMEWYLSGEDEGVLAIIISKRSNGHHIVKDSIDDSGASLKGLTVPLRSGDQTYLYSAEALYQLFCLENHSNKTTRTSYAQRKDISEKIGSIIKENKESAKKIRDDLITSLDWDELPVMIIQSIAISGPDRLQKFYDEVEGRFRDTKPVRSMGFNLNSFGLEAATTGGAYLKSGNRDIAIRLEPNGTLTMAMRGNENFLGWGVNKENLDHVTKINSIVLVEVIFEFVRFVSEVLTEYGLRSWSYTVDIRRFNEYKVSLNRGTPNSFDSSDLKLASKDVLEVNLGRSSEYTSDAFKILTEIYALFTLPESAIPFSDGEKITKETILSINNNLNGW